MPAVAVVSRNPSRDGCQKVAEAVRSWIGVVGFLLMFAAVAYAFAPSRSSGPVGVVDRAALAPGVLEVTKNAVFVGTATGPVQLGEVRATGRKQMAAADWARGVRLESGARFGD